MRFKVSLYVSALILLLAVQVCPQSISLDHVDGLAGNSALGVGQDITFHIRFSNPSDTAFGGLTNGFRVYSTDSATWLSTILDTTGALGQEQFDLGIFLPTFGVNGQSADTVGFGALRISSSGMPSGFDGIALTIGIGPIAPSNIGKTICLDSSYFPPSGVWKWAAPGAIDVFPTWDGPHCYTAEGPQTGDSLIVSPHNLEFVARAGQSLLLWDSLTIESNGAPLSYSVVLDSVPWLRTNSIGGSTPGTMLVSADPSILGAGSYTANIAVSAQADNSPIIVPVTLRILPSGPSVTLDHVDGLFEGNKILTNEEVTFYLRITGDESSYAGIINGFRVHSTTGAHWTTTKLDTTGTLNLTQFDLGVFFRLNWAAASTTGRLARYNRSAAIAAELMP